jgi:hypothetical protein
LCKKNFKNLAEHHWAGSTPEERKFYYLRTGAAPWVVVGRKRHGGWKNVEKQQKTTKNLHGNI